MGDAVDGGFELRSSGVEGVLVDQQDCADSLAPTTACGGSAPPKGEEFVPVQTRPRDDGWTPSRQRAFLEALASCGSVSAAARSIGMSRESAYGLRRRADARGFVQAWDAARLLAAEHLLDLAWDRATQGEVRPLVYHGVVVGELRHYDNRLLLGLIAQNRKVLVEQGLVAPPQVTAAVALDWDAALDRAERGEALDEDDLRRFDGGGAEPGEADISGGAVAAPAADALEPPLRPERDCHGAPQSEAQLLEVGLYRHWWDPALECWLTNWPAPEDWQGEEFRCDATGAYEPIVPGDDADGADDADADDGCSDGEYDDHDTGDGAGAGYSYGDDDWDDDGDDDGEPGAGAAWSEIETYARTLTAQELAGVDSVAAGVAAARARRLELYRRAAFGLASAAERGSLAAANDGRRAV